MKSILLLITLTSSIFALSINSSLLKIHATLVPKIYLMDYKFKNKLKNNTITIAIMYKNRNYQEAKEFRNMIQNRYSDGIKTFKVKPFLVNYKDVTTSSANIYYLFPTDTNNIKKVIKKANSNQALTFSYLKDDLKHGVMISLSVSKKIKPLLNLDAIKSHQIVLRPVLVNISSIFIYDKGSSYNQLKIHGLYEYILYQV